MNKKDLNILKKILAIQSSYLDNTRMYSYIETVLTEINCEVYSDDIGNVYVAKGNCENYPCVVSHIDTVHSISNNVEILEYKEQLYAFDTITNKQIGTGGDDKVGVYICLQMLHKFDNIKIVFFVQEERGCVGSKNSHLPFFDDVSFVVQCDRKGSSEIVRYVNGLELFNDEFNNDILPYLNQYGYDTVSGGNTDVVKLKELGLKIPVFNVSCGYYFPHTSEEIVNISDVEKCLNFVSDIIKNLSFKKYENHNSTKQEMDYWNHFDRIVNRDI